MNNELVSLFRYIRPLVYDENKAVLEFGPRGGISFLFLLDQKESRLRYYSTICSEDDNFSFTISKNVLNGRFQKYGLAGAENIILPNINSDGFSAIYYDRELSLVDNVELDLQNKHNTSLLLVNQTVSVPSLSEDQIALLSRLKKIRRANAALEKRINTLTTNILKKNTQQ